MLQVQDKNKQRKTLIHQISKNKIQFDQEKKLVTKLDQLGECTISFWINLLEPMEKDEEMKKIPVFFIKQDKKKLLEVHVKGQKLVFFLAQIGNDFKVCLDNKLDLLLSCQNKAETMKKSFLDIILKENKAIQLKDIFCAKNTCIDFTNYFQKSQLSLNQNQEDFIPFENYIKHEEYLGELTSLQGTRRGFYTQSLNFRIEGKILPQIEGGFEFEKFLDNLKENVFNFEKKQNSIYPSGSNFIQRKQIFVELKDLFQNYIFIYTGICILAPPVTDENSYQDLNFLSSQMILKKNKYRQFYPLYAICYKRFIKFLKNFFKISKNASETLFNIVHKSPYMLNHLDKNTKQRTHLLIYDKGLQLYCRLFLEQQERDKIKNQLYETNNYQFIYIDPDDDQRKLLVNKIFSLIKQEEIDFIIYDCFMKKSVSFQQINLIDFIQHKELVTSNVIKIQFSLYKQYMTKIYVLLEGDKSFEYIIPLRLLNEDKFDINFFEEKILSIIYYQDEFFLIRKMKIQTSCQMIQFYQEGIDQNIVLKPKTFQMRYEVKSLHALFQEDTFVGFFVKLDPKNVLLSKEEILQDQLIMPKDFNIQEFEKLNLRFDISYFNQKQFESYSNSISVIKYNLEEYTKNTNKIIDFLGNLFPKCSIFTNFISPESIGEFSVFILGAVNAQKIENMKKSSYFLFKNKKINHFPTEEELFDNFCYLLIQTGNLTLLQEKQQHFFVKNNLQFTPQREKVDEIHIDNEKYIIKKKAEKNPQQQLICKNYGCGQKFLSEQNAECSFHFGKWDFGHTGLNVQNTIIEMQLEKSQKLLWKPHWTCCGKGWLEKCTKKHQHNGVVPEKYKELENGMENEQNQKLFKKQIRESWQKQLNKFHKMNRKKIESKFDKLAEKLHVKVDEIPIEQLPQLCDECKMHLLVISNDMSYHFKFMDILNKKAFEYLKTEKGFLDKKKFLDWWFCKQKELENFKQLKLKNKNYNMGKEECLENMNINLNQIFHHNFEQFKANQANLQIRAFSNLQFSQQKINIQDFKQEFKRKKIYHEIMTEYERRNWKIPIKDRRQKNIRSFSVLPFQIKKQNKIFHRSESKVRQKEFEKKHQLNNKLIIKTTFNRKYILQFFLRKIWVKQNQVQLHQQNQKSQRHKRVKITLNRKL